MQFEALEFILGDGAFLHEAVVGDLELIKRAVVFTAEQHLGPFGRLGPEGGRLAGDLFKRAHLAVAFCGDHFAFKIVQGYGRFVVGETGLVFAIAFAVVDPFGITIPTGPGKAATEGRGLKSSFTEGYNLQTKFPLLSVAVLAFASIFALNGEIGILSSGFRSFISQLPLRCSGQ